MIEYRTDIGVRRLFDKRETEEMFAPVRDRIFDASPGSVSFSNDRIFRNDSWLRVLVRGGLFFSDGSRPPCEALGRDDSLLRWAKDDPRDPLHPLFEIMAEDGIRELVHMYPHSASKVVTGAVTTAPTRSAVRGGWFGGVPESCGGFTARLLFDGTERWGFYSDFDELGILGGEPGFMKRYIERTGGMEFIRQKADSWFRETYDDWKFPTVPHAYRLAGWDNPPQRKSDSTK